MSQNKDAIRLTNRTALALRRSAKRIEKISLIAALVITVCLCAATIYLGIQHLWTVPVMLLVIGALDVIIIAFSRSYYLMLLSQAICTEASARNMRESTGEARRRERAISDLAQIHSDLRAAGLDDGDEQEDDDLAAPAPKAQVKMPKIPDSMRAPQNRKAPQNTQVPSAQKTMVVPNMRKLPVRMNEGRQEDGQQNEDGQSVETAEISRRRRRNPSLQVLHMDQAK